MSKSRGSSWADRHPAAAVIAALFTLVFMGMMLSVHPLAAAVMLAVAAVAAVLWLADRERGRRAATAARAERENRAWLAAPLQWPAPAPLSPPTHVARRPRGVDHWSPTEPIYGGRK